MQLRFYKGDYTDILKVVEAYPSGGNPGDFVTIRDQVLFWHPERGNWIAEQHGIGSNAAILYTLLEMFKHMQSIDDEIAKLWACQVSIASPVITCDAEGTVTITDDTEGVDIYYTTDGTNPASGNKYTEAFTVEEECTIKAIAVKTVNERPIYSDVTTKAVSFAPLYYIGWGMTIKDLASTSMTGNNIVSYAKISDSKTQELSQLFTNESGQALWALVPDGKKVTFDLEQNGTAIPEANQTIIYPEDKQSTAVKTYNGKTYHLMCVSGLVGTATITKITYADNA